MIHKTPHAPRRPAIPQGMAPVGAMNPGQAVCHRLTACVVIGLLVGGVVVLLAPAAVAAWQLDQDDPGVGTSDPDVPAPYLYTPSTGSSEPMRRSLRLASGDAFTVAVEEALAGSKKGSFTIEAYVKPDRIPNQSWRILGRGSSRSGGGTLAAGVRHLRQWKQAYWGGFATSAGQREVSWSTGHYVTISRLRQEQLGWRHLALVYDADRSRATVYLDHWQTASHELAPESSWDEQPFRIGGEPNGSGFEGKVAAVRISPGALTPDRFLRGVQEPLENVDFAPRPTVLPLDSGAYDVRTSFGAVGDGETDDTLAFQRAFDALSNKRPAEYNTLYIPPGEYLVSETLWCSRFIVIRGAGPEQTVIRLADRSRGFQQARRPTPLLRLSSTRGDPGSNKGVNGSSIGIYVSGLTLHTGRGNPGAKAVEFHTNNHGAMQDMRLVSGDGRGVVGLDLTHKTVGPGLVKNVTIEGFDHGVHIKYQEYSMTFEHLTLEGQRRAGVLNESNILAIRGLQSRNRVPAVLARGANSMTVLLDSELSGGSSVADAINTEGALYARNIKVEGYGQTVASRHATWHGWKAKPKLTWADGSSHRGNIEELLVGEPVTPFGGPASSLNLPVEETPGLPWGDPQRDWVNVNDFTDRVSDGDWTAAIQAAINSGAQTVYFPPGGYEVRGTVRVGGDGVRLLGMRANLHWPTVKKPQGKRVFHSYREDAPLLLVEGGDADRVVVLEHLNVTGRLHFDAPGSLVLLHTRPSTLTNGERAGKLFAENFMGNDVHVQAPLRMWVRQWNPERHGPGPCITSDGAAIWSLGFKTEYDSSKLWASNGAKTEILGGFIYPVVKGIPKERPVFQNEDSAMSLIFGKSFYVAGHYLQVRDTQDGRTLETSFHEMKQIGSRFRMDLYRSGP
ncbi:MAG: glycosyl hydrolase family 28-related protein [Planctomycetota bacterium]